MPILFDEVWSVQLRMPEGGREGGWWWVHHPPGARRSSLTRDRRLAARVGAPEYAANLRDRLLRENPKAVGWRVVESKWGQDRVIAEGNAEP